MGFNIMVISILATGSELLDGSVIETNSNFIAMELQKIGLPVSSKICVRDSSEDLLSALGFLSRKSNVIIITGGLGPTEDDKTRQSAAEFYGRKLVYDESVWQGIEKIFTRARLKLADENKKQAFVIEGSAIIPNPAGTAPGFIIAGETVLAAFPGVPSELKSMFPFFIDFLLKTGNDIKRRTSVFVKTIGLPESYVDEECAKISGKDAVIGTIAGMGQVTLRYDFRDELPYDNALENVKSWLSLAPDIVKRVFSYDPGSSIEHTLVELLKSRGKKLLMAESCTGGLISKLITDVPGSSGAFSGSVVSYADEIKTACLGVNPQTIKIFGAVSFETAHEMTEGLSMLGSPDYCVSVTGIAGPGGGTPEKPSGTVFISLRYSEKGKAVRSGVYQFLFTGSREMVRMRTAMKVFEMLWLDLTYGEIDEKINYTLRR